MLHSGHNTPRSTTLATHVIGWIAVVLTQVFYIPNTLKILRTKDVQGYSLVGWGMLLVGLGCYLIYFAAERDVIGVVANICGVSGAGLTTFCIWRWRSPRRTAAPLDGTVAPATANQG